MRVYSSMGHPRCLSDERICLPTQEMWVWSLSQEEPLEEEMATHSIMLAWEIPWTKELGRLQSMGSQRVRYDIATKQQHLGRKHRKGEFLSISLTSLNDISYVSRTQKVVIYFGLQDSGQIWKTSDL